MCSTCGCNQPGGVKITKLANDFTLIEDTNLLSGHHHHHSDSLPDQQLIQVEKDILSKNNHQAEHNRFHFESQHILALNLVSSPGSGKTSLLERTLVDIKSQYTCYVVEGDQQTLHDAERVAATGVQVVQINTGKGCHLDADMVHKALHELNPVERSLVFIENVGNLVCPALFDLGEQDRVAIISVTEGEDKPLKYPDMFESSDLCIINKIDLLPYVNFDVEKAKAYATRVNPKLTFIELSATSGEGITGWYDWLKAKHELALNRVISEVAES